MEVTGPFQGPPPYAVRRGARSRGSRAKSDFELSELYQFSGGFNGRRN